MDSKINHIILDLYDEAQHCPISEFASRSLSKLQKLLKFDSAGIASFSAAADRTVNANAAYVFNQPIEKITYRQSNIPTGFLKNDGNIISRDPMITACWQERGRSKYTSLVDMNADEDLKNYNKKFDTIQIMTIALKNAQPDKADYISLWRAGRKNYFEEKDARLGDLLLPHLNKAIEINKKIIDPLSAGVVVIFCSPHGFIHFTDNAIINILQEEWSEWTPPILPQQFIHKLVYTAGHQYVGKSITARAEVNGNLVVIKVALNPIGKLLTPSELKVALCIADGMSYKEAARILDISPATVRNQLHSVYKKTGQSGRSELAKLLNRQSF